MNPDYFESIAKHRRNGLLQEHLREIETKLAQELKPIVAELERTMAWRYGDLERAYQRLTNSIDSLAQEFKNSDEYGKQLNTATYKNKCLEGTTKGLETQIANLKTEVELKNDKITELNAEITKLKSTDVRLENATHKATIKELESQRDALQQQLTEQINIAEQLKADLAKIEATKTKTAPQENPSVNKPIEPKI
ncbi:hypothetical protein NHP190002_05680 [Helicobacter ailurogastricus]|nr:hypothetical protein NHP190002_05680 [Helicobacter ailurogastricus]